MPQKDKYKEDYYVNGKISNPASPYAVKKNNEYSSALASEPAKQETVVGSEQTKPEPQPEPEHVSYAQVFGNENKTDYNSLREETAADLLSKNIQVEMAKAAAQRNLQNSMAAQGLDNSGAYGAGMAQLQSNAMAQRNANLSDYAKVLREIDQEERTAQDNARSAALDNLSDSLQQTTNTSQINRVLQNYGISVTQNADGSLNISGAEGLGEETQAQLRNLIQGTYENVVEASNPAINDLATAYSTLTTVSGNKADESFGVKDELKFLFNTSEGQKLAKEGTVVKLLSSSNEAERNKMGDFLFLVYRNGAWRKATEAEFLAQPKGERPVIHGTANKKATYVDWYGTYDKQD